jgi:hypothetical protein
MVRVRLTARVRVMRFEVTVRDRDRVSVQNKC